MRYRRGQVIVCPESGGETPVPLAELSTVLIGLKVRIHGGLLHQLAANDVIMLAADWRGTPVGGYYGWRDHSRVGARQLAQAHVTLPRQKNAWGQIIRSKISGQACNLRLFSDPNWQRLEQMSKSVRSGDPSNTEAQAARYYWGHIFGSHDLFLRNPGGGQGRNNLLDYGYSILRGHGIRAVLSAGLNPSQGLFHRGRSNYFNLVDDLIEPFRPALDYAVATMDLTADLTADTKAKLVEASSQPFSNDGLGVAACLTDLAQQLGRYFEGDIDKLKVLSWKGPQDNEQRF